MRQLQAVAAATPAPVLSLPSGVYGTGSSVSLSNSQPGAVIYYTTDGSYPSTNSPAYSSRIAISNTFTLQAIAMAPGAQASPMAAAVYQVGANIASSGGFAGSSSFALNGAAKINGGGSHLPIGLGLDPQVTTVISVLMTSRQVLE